MNIKNKGTKFILLSVMLAIAAGAVVYGGINMTFRKVPVFVAQIDIQAGDPLKSEMFSEKQIPVGGVQKDTLKPPISFDTLVASKNIAEGDYLKKTNSVDMEDKDISVLASRLATLKDKSLIGVDLDVASIDGMLGGMSAGNHVIIGVGWLNKDAEVAGSKNPVYTSEIIAENVPVVGLRSASDGGSGVLSVALTKVQYLRYIELKDKGKITIGLHPLGFKGN